MHCLWQHTSAFIIVVTLLFFSFDRVSQHCGALCAEACLWQSGEGTRAQCVERVEPRCTCVVACTSGFCSVCVTMHSVVIALGRKVVSVQKRMHKRMKAHSNAPSCISCWTHIAAKLFQKWPTVIHHGTSSWNLSWCIAERWEALVSCCGVSQGTHRNTQRLGMMIVSKELKAQLLESKGAWLLETMRMPGGHDLCARAHGI